MIICILLISRSTWCIKDSNSLCHLHGKHSFLTQNLHFKLKEVLLMYNFWKLFWSLIYWSVPWLNVISILPSRVHPTLPAFLLALKSATLPVFCSLFSCLFVSENFKRLLSPFSSGFKLLHLWKMRCKNISKYKHTQVSFIVKQTHKPTTKTLPVVVHSPSPFK